LAEGAAIAECRQQLLRHRMRGHADGDGVLSARDGVMNIGGARHDHGERTGPEALRQTGRRLRDLPHPAMQVARAIEMHDDRVVARPALGRENLAHRGGILRIGAEAVDRLGRKGDQLAVAQRLHGGLDLDLGCPDDSNHDGANSSKPAAAHAVSAAVAF
jgi:hypothetical protein